MPLHVCPSCGSKLVQVIASEEVANDRWSLMLRCPECGLIASGEFEPSEVEALDAELQRGDAELAETLALVVQLNMADVLEHFVRALEADAIQPMDF
jgi:uncharacterized Zn finger protein